MELLSTPDLSTDLFRLQEVGIEQISQMKKV